MTAHHAAISERWLLLIAILVGIAIGYLWRHGVLTRAGEKADYWRGQARRLANRVRRQADRIRDLQERCDYYEEQANGKAAEATRRSRQLAQVIGHPAAGSAAYYQGRDN